jgi:hypothetical protein
MANRHSRVPHAIDPTAMKQQRATCVSLSRTSVVEYAKGSFTAVRVQVFQHADRASRAIAVELVKIYRTQNHTKLVGETFASHGVGLLMGMLSAKFVSRFFDVKGMHNLWGLFSQRTLVSEQTYQALCFAAEFFVALAVFTLTDHFINEYRSRRQKREPGDKNAN